MFKLSKETQPIFNMFKFKNLKHFDTRDGIEYSCELFYGNQKIADVENDGHGGITYIDYVPGSEEIFNSLNIPQYYENQDLGFRIDNEYIISDLVELAIWIKNVMRNQSKAIVFIKGDKAMEIKLKSTIVQFSNAGKMELLANKVKELEKEGYLVLNTNINR
jgi:hypothetical protein